MTDNPKLAARFASANMASNLWNYSSGPSSLRMTNLKKSRPIRNIRASWWTRKWASTTPNINYITDMCTKPPWPSGRPTPNCFSTGAMPSNYPRATPPRANNTICPWQRSAISIATAQSPTFVGILVNIAKVLGIVCQFGFPIRWVFWQCLLPCHTCTGVKLLQRNAAVARKPCGTLVVPSPCVSIHISTPVAHIPRCW